MNASNIIDQVRDHNDRKQVTLVVSARVVSSFNKICKKEGVRPPRVMERLLSSYVQSPVGIDDVESPPKDRNGFPFRISESVYAQFQKACQKKNMKFGPVIEWLVTQFTRSYVDSAKK